MTPDDPSPSQPPSPGTGAGGPDAALARITEVLEQRAPAPASQSAHALWIGGLVSVLYLVGARGIGMDTPVVSLISVAAAGGLIFSLSWFEGRAAKRGHGLGRKEMAKELKELLRG